MVLKNGREAFYIETKMSHAQCGQFVAFPNSDTRKFDYSPYNAFKENLQSQSILEKMSEEFDFYENPQTDGIELKMDSEFFSAWIGAFYTTKKVKFFIVEKEVGQNNLSKENFVLFPVARFQNYFSVK